MNSDSTREIPAQRRAPEAGATDEVTQEFARFYQSGRPRIFYHALALVGDREAAEDLTQDTFLRLFVEIKCGSPIRSAWQWTHRVLRNLALNYIAHAGVVSRTIQADAEIYPEIIPHNGPSVEQELIGRERQDVLVRARERLLPLERECLRLFADGCSYQLIAHHQQIGYSVAVATVRRALRKVRKQLAVCHH
jgi:RNA polymerase sigma factor (sigma-70 family)